MPDPAQFGHDRLAHLLSDRLMGVPHFQRGYAWESGNVLEFLEDLKIAREDDQQYFMGTIVLAEDPDDPGRQIIVDGQQRLITTAVLIAAIRDRLKKFDKVEAVTKINNDYLNTFHLDSEDVVIRLRPSLDDLETYESIVCGTPLRNNKHPLITCYNICLEHVTDLAPSESDYRSLISFLAQLTKSVQVLLAVASGLAEAYVIFETLNDRGADLTTADLLKNYLFSQAKEYSQYVQQRWTRISATFDKPDDLVRFIRYEHSARYGKVTNRKLYKALQTSIGRGSRPVREYANRLENQLGYYTALRDPDSEFWGSTNVDVRDGLLAFRRFGFESSTPLLMAALSTWDLTKAAKLINKVAAWSVRAWFAGRLGGGTAEEVFCDAAVQVSDRRITNQPEVFSIIQKIVPDDQVFKRSFLTYGYVSTGRAKYLLAQLERQACAAHGESFGAQLDWSARSVSIDHIFAESSDRERFASGKEYERFLGMKNTLANYTLLERTFNRDMEDSPFADKVDSYAKSKFGMTRELANSDGWALDDAEARLQKLAELAVQAWPRS